MPRAALPLTVAPTGAPQRRIPLPAVLAMMAFLTLALWSLVSAVVG